MADTKSQGLVCRQKAHVVVLACCCNLGRPSRAQYQSPDGNLRRHIGRLLHVLWDVSHILHPTPARQQRGTHRSLKNHL
ncbi:hypothetical protein ACFX12_016806 [Malus domestica]